MRLKLFLIFAAAAALAVAVLLNTRRHAAVLVPVVSRTALATAVPKPPRAPHTRSATTETVHETPIYLNEAGAASNPVYAHTASIAPTAKSLEMATIRLASARPVTSRSEGEFSLPRWSQDGAQIEFHDRTRKRRWRKDLQAGTVSPLKNDGDNPAAVLDDDTNPEVPVTVGYSDRIGFDLHGNPHDSTQVEQDGSLTGTYVKDDKIYLRLNPGEPGRLITDGDDYYFGAVVSPDRRYLVYSGRQTGMYIKSLDSPSPAVFLGEGYEPSWLPDSSGIVFCRVERDEANKIVQSDLYFAGLDGQSVSNLTQSPDRLEFHPSVNPKKPEVAFESDGTIQVGEIH